MSEALEAAKAAHAEAVKNYQAAIELRRTVEGQYAAAQRMLDAEFRQPRLEALNARDSSERALNAARVALAEQSEHPFPIGAVVVHTGKYHDGERGVTEIFRHGAKTLSHWDRPAPGTMVVRFLLKSGKPAARISIHLENWALAGGE